MVFDPSALFEAAQKGHLAHIEALAASSPSHEWTSAFQPRSGDSALMLAARCGHLPVVQLALRCGAPPDQRNFESKTALMEAAQHGRAEVVRCLLTAGANPNALKRADWTALMLACTKENEETVDSLLQDPRTQLRLHNKDGWSAFHLACREGHVSVLRRLLAADGELWRSKSRTGRSVLHTAALHGRLQAVRLLLQQCSFPPDEADSCGSTPLMDALRNGHLEVAEQLLEQGASLQKTDALGRQSIHHVSEAGQLDSFQFLLDRCPPVQLVNSPALPSLTRPLHLAGKEGQFHMVARLLGCGADPSLLDAKGRSPFDCATEECRGLLSNYALN